MFARMLSIAVFSSFGISLVLGASDAVWTVPDGFTLTEVDIAPGPAFVGGFAFSPAGDPLVFDGDAVVQLTDGAATVLHRPEPAVFGSFLDVDPDGSSVYFGESSGGTIARIPLDGGDPAVVETIAFNFDMAFDPGGRPFVSAPIDFETNGVWLLDLEPSSEPVLVARVPGASGPLAFSPTGDLIIATSGWMVPSDILRFPRAAIDGAIGGSPLAIDAADVIATGLDGAFGMTLDGDGSIFVANSATGSIIRVDSSGSFGDFARPMEGLFASPTFIAFRPGEESFCPGAGPAGGAVAFASSDFGTFNRLTVITPSTVHFVRGEANGDGAIDVADAVWLLGFLFGQGQTVSVADAADVNDDGQLDVGDAITLLNYLFLNGPAPPAPFPGPGSDPTPDDIPCG